ncbi:MAG: undecaprenyl-diphosphatase, partial [Kordiimonadaceae bacterium]|nr:undecaprenyl-diphosphatase [Kordiimonadaceae bacterium]
MTLIQLIILALVQGITEFLPISSSGHLILIPTLTGWTDQGLFIDVALHVGTLTAVLLYFRSETKGLFLAAAGNLGIAPARRATEGTLYHQLLWGLIIGTIPMVIVGGLIVAADIMDSLRTAEVIATTSITFGLLLYWADKKGMTEKTLERMALRPALLIGLAQVFALIPG